MHFVRALGGLAVLLLSLPLTGCSHSAVERPPVPAVSAQPYQGDVGKTMWVEFGVYACSKAGTGGECAMLPAKTKFQIVRLTSGTISAGTMTFSDPTVYYQLQLDDGRTVYARAPMVGVTDIDPDVAAAECQRRGAPRIGMTAKQVEATCWGKPDHVNRRQTAGAISEQYVYDNGRFVHLRNGIVTSIQTSGTLR